MHRTRVIVLAAVGFLLLAAAFLFVVNLNLRERARITSRYEQMRSALSANDTDTARALIAPYNRDGFARFDLLDMFARSLDSRSSIRVFRGRALVCPKRTPHYLVIPGGHTVEMVKIEGIWYFTGKVNID